MNNKKIFKTSLILASVILLAACHPFLGEKVEVPPAHVGKVLTKDGYKHGDVNPSRFRLDRCVAYCDSLILLEMADRGKTESFKLFMPKDQLNMEFNVRMTVAVNPRKIDDIYKQIAPAKGKISFDSIYTVYARPIIRDEVRQIMARYSINEIASSREKISDELLTAVERAMDGSALTVKRFGLADVQFPEIITKAKEAAAERREQIEREKAESTREVNAILAKSVTDKYLSYRSLEVLEKMAKSSNKVFVPVEALGTIGLQQDIFKSAVKNSR
ncbi:SPFH domain-containing protein [uncultured Shewanella sp.]|uniref:SPFH domain-containing protein n=1 Tax=uncultured Shewanella sp. TaxID=173975 RepID=UPI00262AB71F|nr:SPFH domain-containing protein [uncultured Shewanella sp.]